jgi:phosphoglycerol transferase MdoB-like AlkP superfamily enzyme
MKSVSNLPGKLATHPWLMLLCVMLLIELAAEMVFRGACNGLLMAWSISPLALLCNTWLLAAGSVLLYVATNRLALTLLLVCSSYLCMVVGNLLKTGYMHATVQPMDFVYLPEFFQISGSFLGVFGIAALIVGLLALLGGSILLWNRGRCAQRAATRVKAAAIGALAMLVGVGMVVGAGSHGDILGLGTNTWDSIRAVNDRGLLLELFSECRFLRVTPPARYTQADVADCVQRYLPAPTDPRSTPVNHAEQVNLIFYLVESLIDPREFGVKLTGDPIPYVRAVAAKHTSGYVVSPEAFGGSANSEFELLTGMSLRFLPLRSCPYKQYIKRDLSSLPWMLKAEGYRTAAILADPRRFYNRGQVMGHLGFEKTQWLGEVPGTPIDASGRWPADAAIVDAIIATSQGPGPFFIFAFPGSTHSPWDYDAYRDSELDAAEPLPSASQHELKTYINAIRETDRQLGRLLEYFRHLPGKTLIVISGDHVPPTVYHSAAFDTLFKQRRTPLIFWSNYLPKQPDVVCSYNFVAAHALAMMSLKPRGFLALNARWSTALGVLSPGMLTSEGHRYDEEDLHNDLRQVVNDYQLIQWDLLFGHQYAESLLPSTP